MSGEGRDEIHARGMEVRRAVLGDAHVDRAIERTTPFTEDFQDLITRYAWGEIWSRPGLDRRTRSCVTLTALVASGREHELEMHVRAALRNGLTPDEIGEVLLQCAVYCGVPAANGAFAIAQRVLDSLDAGESCAVSTYVLVHGAWHDGSCWADVAAELRAAGHEVHAPTLAGQGRGDVDRFVGHAEAVASAAEAIVSADLDDIVLVGHSYGGTVVSKLAELLPERIRRLVYWNAFVLLDGESLYDVSPPHYNDAMDADAAERGDGSVVLPYPVWREAFMNDADEALARKIYDERLSPHPVKTLRDPLELKVFPTLEIPRSYLNCTEDTAMPPGAYGWHPRFSSRLGLHRLVQMPGGHEALFTNPRLLRREDPGGRT